MSGASARLLAEAEDAPEAVDSLGRRYALRRLTALDKLRLYEAAGPELSRNDRWLGMAALAASVTGIDDVPVPPPGGKAAIEAIIRRLGDEGIAAVAAALARDLPDAAAIKATAGN